MQGPALHLADGCFDKLAKLGHYEFNVSVADKLSLEPEWMARERLDSILSGLGDRHADVFARLQDHRSSAPASQVEVRDAQS